MSPARRTPEATEALRSSLVDHARRIVVRDGAAALTMRGLAAEAGCAVGLTYKVFTDRRDLVAEICLAELERLEHARGELVGRAGTATVAANLAWFADLLLDSPAVALVPEVFADDGLAEVLAARAHTDGIGPGGFETTFATYLAAEKRAGRVAADVDEEAFGFLLAGAIHNLVVSGDAWPRPTRRKLADRLAGVAAAISPRS
ncbi:MAG TPA: TetR/AcrR family transcriptional regulator [Acidimicrobiales bacterium]